MNYGSIKTMRCNHCKDTRSITTDITGSTAPCTQCWDPEEHPAPPRRVSLLYAKQAKQCYAAMQTPRAALGRFVNVYA